MKRILFLLFILISLIIIYNFFSSIYRLLSKKDVLVQAQNELRTVQKENLQLKKQLAKVKNPEFVEEQARDKLFLVKPGEKMVIIPGNLLPTPTPIKSSAASIPHWMQWFKVFSR